MSTGVRYLCSVAVLGSLLLLGCESKSSYPGGAKTSSLEAPNADGLAMAPQGMPGMPGLPGGKEGAKAAAIPRKLVYNADLSIIVKENIEGTREHLKELIKSFDGLLTQEDASGMVGSQRNGKWTIRVPIERFDPFLVEVRKLGIVERETTKSQDVTEEFYDLQARIKQKKVEEESLLKLQAEAASIVNKDPKARMEDLLAVRREWNAVRQEIERMEGRLKLLTNLSDLTTVTVSIVERKEYVPASAPTFTGKISDTFDSSVRGLRTFGENLVLFLVGVAPWLPLLFLAAYPLYRLMRGRRRNAA
jgi:hypothetical protein